MAAERKIVLGKTLGNEHLITLVTVYIRCSLVRSLSVPTVPQFDSCVGGIVSDRQRVGPEV